MRAFSYVNTAIERREVDLIIKIFPCYIYREVERTIKYFEMCFRKMCQSKNNVKD